MPQEHFEEHLEEAPKLSLHLLAALWTVLLRDASEQKPLSIKEICEKSDDLKTTTAKNELDQLETDTFPMSPFPGQLCCVTKVSGSYVPYHQRPNRGSKNNATRLYYLGGLPQPGQLELLQQALEAIPGLNEDVSMAAALDQLLEWFPASSLREEELPKTATTQGEIVELLLWAIHNKRPVFIDYGTYQLESQPDGSAQPMLVSRDSEDKRLYHPYALFFHQGYGYLTARRTRKGLTEPANFRLDRILSVTVDPDGKPFTIPKELCSKVDGSFNRRGYQVSHPLMYLGETGKVQLLCKNTLLNLACDVFPGAKFTKEDDQHFRLTATVSLKGAVVFALQYPDQCQLLSPAKQREKIAKVLAKAAEAYKTNPTSI